MHQNKTLYINIEHLHCTLTPGIPTQHRNQNADECVPRYSVNDISIYARIHLHIHTLYKHTPVRYTTYAHTLVECHPWCMQLCRVAAWLTSSAALSLARRTLQLQFGPLLLALLKVRKPADVLLALASVLDKLIAKKRGGGWLKNGGVTVEEEKELKKKKGVRLEWA